VDALLGWLTDPDETARLPQRLRDLVDLADAELAGGRTDDEALSGQARVERARGRAIVDFVAALTDGQAVALLDAISGRSGQLWTDAFVL
jgi:dGTPase